MILLIISMLSQRNHWFKPRILRQIIKRIEYYVEEKLVMQDNS